MLLTAVIGAVIGLISYEIVYFLNPISPRATASWAIASIIGIARQHGLHRWLTFTHHSPYWRSLRRAYIMYSGAVITTTGVNWGLTTGLGMHHLVAWAICLLVQAAISLIFLKRYVFRSEYIPV